MMIEPCALYFVSAESAKAFSNVWLVVFDKLDLACRNFKNLGAFKRDACSVLMGQRKLNLLGRLANIARSHSQT